MEKALRRCYRARARERVLYTSDMQWKNEGAHMRNIGLLTESRLARDGGKVALLIASCTQQRDECNCCLVRAADCELYAVGAENGRRDNSQQGTRSALY